MKSGFIALILFPCFLFAQDTKTTQELPVLMQQFFANVYDLKPYMVSFEEFQKKENRSKILNLLSHFEKQIETNQVTKLKTPGFSLTYDLMGKHLRETSYLFEHEIYQMAWNNLRATTQFCIACHDRLPKSVGSFSWPAPTKILSLPVEARLKEADFLYIAHQFVDALGIYDQVIRTYRRKPGTSGATEDLDHAYQRKIAFMARVQRQPQKASQSLAEDLKNPELPLETRKNIETWIVYFDLWAKEGKTDPSLLKDAELVRFAKNIVDQNTGGRKITIADPYVVNLLRVSGLLYERVFQKQKSPDLQEMLYLLARCEKDLHPIRNYSLADLYFKECILTKPHSKTAKQCFSEYELSMKQKNRSGSSEYIEAGLESLRKLSY